jgi:thermitase
MMKAYRKHPSVEYAEPNYMGRGGDIFPNDTFFPIQWHLNNTGQSGGTHDADINAVEGWQITQGKASVIVAILDTGIRSSHPDFQGRLLPGYDFVNDDTDPEADHPHGIMVTGILAANSDNAFAVAGVDHQAMLLPIKVLDSANLGTTFDLAEGLVYAGDRGAHVVNMSLINYPRQGRVLEDALTYAWDAGAVLIACAGNGGVRDADRSYPGASPLTISVGATDHNDARASFSGTGKALDVVAPGLNVVTTADATSFDTYTRFSGCSAATPVASGTASLLLALDEHLTHERVRQIMIQTAEDQVGPPEEDTPGRDDFFGYGRINLNDALKLSQSALVVAIDIDPNSEFNRIRPASTKPVSVAVFGDTGLDVTRLSCSSLGFGPSQAEAIDCEIADVNDDGFDDLVASFQINETGIACGDTEATLVGTTLDGFSIIGTDRVTTIGCRS